MNTVGDIINVMAAYSIKPSQKDIEVDEKS
jgi:hypothetical protein